MQELEMGDPYVEDLDDLVSSDQFMGLIEDHGAGRYNGLLKDHPFCTPKLINDVCPFVGESPLIRACRLCSVETVYQLLEMGAYVVTRLDEGGNTCLMAAARNRDEGRGLAITRLLFDRHGDACAQMLNARDSHYNTALSFAASHSLELTQTLLAAGASVIGLPGAVSLRNAVNSGQQEIVDALLTSRSNWGRVEGDHDMLLHATISEGFEEVVRVVLDRVMECAVAERR
jgi:ankyrin repeat protein